MKNENGYIRLNRGIVSWEWWDDIKTFRVFIWLLLNANWKDSRFMGHKVPRGSLVTSYPKIAAGTCLGIQSVRTAINHLKLTGELTVKSYSKFSIISINNYCRYQEDNTQDNSHLTDNQQATNRQLTTIEKGKKEKKEKKEKREGNTYLDLITEKHFSDQINAVVTEWLRYKQEKKQTYQESGFKQLLNTIGEDIKENGEDHVIRCFRYSMTNNYNGVFFDRKEEDSGKSKGEAPPAKRDTYREWMHEQLHGEMSEMP